MYLYYISFVYISYVLTSFIALGFGTDKRGITEICCTKLTQAVDNPNKNEDHLTAKVRKLLDEKLIQEFPKLKPDFECGKVNSSFISRITGAKNSTLGAWPWMAALGYKIISEEKLKFHCGAAIVTDRWLVTAAHCVNSKFGITLVSARIGDLNLDERVDDGATPTDILIEQQVIHPNYTTRPFVNDIALLKLSQKINFTDLVKPICLLSGSIYQADNYYNKKSMNIAGWGRTFASGPLSDHLQDTNINIVNNTACAALYSGHKRAVIDNRVLCAGSPGKDTCQGDSGGPLMLANATTKSYFLAGITSYGIGCGDESYPGVYTRVAAFINWISAITGFDFG